MILNENVIKDLRSIRAEDGEDDIEAEIGKVLRKHKVDYDEVYQNELSPEFVRVYKDKKEIMQISLSDTTEIEDDDIVTYFIIVNEIDEL